MCSSDLPALDKEKHQFQLHRREDHNILLKMYTWSSRIVKEFTDLGVSSPPTLKVDHSRTFMHYTAFLEYVATLVRGVRERTSGAPFPEGEQAIRQAITRIVVALHQQHPQLSLLSELERLGPGMPTPPNAAGQVDEILGRLSREDNP